MKMHCTRVTQTTCIDSSELSDNVTRLVVRFVRATSPLGGLGLDDDAFAMEEPRHPQHPTSGKQSDGCAAGGTSPRLRAPCRLEDCPTGCLVQLCT